VDENGLLFLEAPVRQRFVAFFSIDFATLGKRTEFRQRKSCLYLLKKLGDLRLGEE
jgi:hypothetical protein